MSGELFVVATPIGNLEDMTLRAIETLRQVDGILCEDTRVTKKLLQHLGISKQLISYHHHSSPRDVQKIIDLLKAGQALAMVTDAGTPGVSDPGNQLVALVAKEDVRVTPIPGPSALSAALSVSGFPVDRFLFLGFIPHKKKRRQFLQSIADTDYPAVFFESPHRIHKTLQELKQLFDPSRQLCICRELTKTFETVYRGRIDEIETMNIPAKGEFVVLCNGK